MKTAIGILLVLSLVTWLMYGIDKRRAKKALWRIKERTLFLSVDNLGNSYLDCGVHTEKLVFVCHLHFVEVTEYLSFTGLAGMVYCKII
jgi:hypothetical protein